MANDACGLLCIACVDVFAAVVYDFTTISELIQCLICLVQELICTIQDIHALNVLDAAVLHVAILMKMTTTTTKLTKGDLSWKQSNLSHGRECTLLARVRSRVILSLQPRQMGRPECSLVTRD